MQLDLCPSCRQSTKLSPSFSSSGKDFIWEQEPKNWNYEWECEYIYLQHKSRIRYLLRLPLLISDWFPLSCDGLVVIITEVTCFEWWSSENYKKFVFVTFIRRDLDGISWCSWDVVIRQLILMEKFQFGSLPFFLLEGVICYHDSILLLWNLLDLCWAAVG